LAGGAELSVIVLNGTDSSGAGTPVNLEVTNPAPTITKTLPTTVVLGAVSPVIEVVGTGFVPTSVLDVNGQARSTFYVSATQVEVILTAADVAATGSLSLTAVNGTPGREERPQLLLVCPKQSAARSASQPFAFDGSDRGHDSHDYNRHRNELHPRVDGSIGRIAPHEYWSGRPDDICERNAVDLCSHSRSAGNGATV